MANAVLDGNHNPTMIGTLSTDGETPTLVKATASNHAVDVSDNTTGSDLSDDVASLDANHFPVLMAVSSADGSTPVAVYVNSSGELLVDSS